MSEPNVDPPAAEREPDNVTPEPRRTVSLEVLTDELREFAPGTMWGGAVALVLRVGGQVVGIPEVDTYWSAAWRQPADVLSQMLVSARTFANDAGDDQKPADLLMPGAAVLAALDGRPDAQLLTAPVHVLALDVEAGMLLADFGDALLQRVDRVGKCEKPDCDEGASCVVLTFDGGEQHQSGYARTRVRIPVSVTL